MPFDPDHEKDAAWLPVTDALQYLREAINRGYKDADGMMADDDLQSLRSDPEFQQLVAELRRPSETAAR